MSSTWEEVFRLMYLKGLSREMVTNSLKEDPMYWFLEGTKQLLQEEKLALQCTIKPYLQRLSVIWSCLLSDTNRVQASNQLAMPVLSYLMWSQQTCMTPTGRHGRSCVSMVASTWIESERVVTSAGLKATVYLPRALGGRGMRSVEEEYKMTKIKSAIKLYGNNDSTMSLVWVFGENVAHQAISHSSKRLESLQRYQGSPLTWVFRTSSAVTTQMEQTYLEIRSRGSSKRLHWSGGKLKSWERDGKGSFSQLDGRRTSWTGGMPCVAEELG